MRNSFSSLDNSDSDLEEFRVSSMGPKCEPLCCFSDRLYFTTFPHPAPNPETFNRLAADTNYRPRVRPRPRGFPATSPDEDASYYYFTIDDQLIYLSFFQDWGPLNIAMLYKACILIHELLEDKDLATHRLVLYSSNDPKKKANAALLMALYVMIVQRRAPWEAFHPIAEIEFMPFRDAGRGPSDFNLNIQDCLWGIWKAMQHGLCDMNEFDIEDYEFYEKVENGDWNWITPNFVAFASPVDQNWIKRQKEVKDDAGSSSPLASSTSSHLALQGKLPTPFLNCLDYFEKRNIKLVVRLNNPLYDRTTFLDRGIDHMELYFDDGTNPTDEIVRTFLDVADRVIEDGGVVAVHCKAGLGRTASLIGAYLIWKYGFTANEAIAFMRIVRPGCVVGPQQQYLYLKQLEWSKWAAIDEARKIQAAAAASPASVPTVVTPATPPADTDEELVLRPTTPLVSRSALPLPPVTPSRHVAAAAAKAKEIAPPGQPRKTPKAKRAAPEHDSDDEDDILGLHTDSDSDEMNDILPSLHVVPSAALRARSRAGSTSKAAGRTKIGAASRGVTASEQRPTRVTRSTAGAAAIRKTGTATGTSAKAGAAGPSVTASPTKATTGQRPNKIPRLAMGKSTVGLASKAAAAAKADSKPDPLPTVTMTTRSKPIPHSPIPSRLPTLVPSRTRLVAHHSNSTSDAAANTAALLNRKKNVGASTLKAKDDTAAPAWMATGKAAGVVVTSGSGNKLSESRPGLRSSMRRRRSSFSSADVVA